jgi:phage terminase large subunit
MMPIDKVRLPIWSAPLFWQRRYKSVRGGRGSSKSWTIADALLMIMHEPYLYFKDHRTKIRVLCAREFQNSIEESVHNLLSSQIDRLGLRPWFNVQQRVITHANGSEFIFKGLAKNINTIKSMEDIDILWVEEAHSISNRSWEIVIPTIRNEESQIWFSWNPDDEKDPTWQRFVVNAKEFGDDLIDLIVNWQDNPFFNEALRKEKDYLYRVDPEAAAHVWEGQLNTRSNAVIFRGKYHVERLQPHQDSEFDEENWRGPYYGADWGFSNDPTVLNKLWISPKKSDKKILYIQKESWGIGVELDQIAPKWRREIPECESGVIRADCARPETISHVRGKGLNVIAAKKWTGSVEDGIAFLRSFDEIVIDPSCERQIEEARLYKYKVDKLTGDVLTDIVDMHNHGWDSNRYALEPMIGRKKSIYEVL